jgi:hypothetical protein
MEFLAVSTFSPLAAENTYQQQPILHYTFIEFYAALQLKEAQP